MQNKIRLLTIQFDTPISFQQISSFRGAVVATVDNDILFHNHVDSNYRYAYPLIQYKRIGGKAAIVCVGEGTESIGQMFSACNSSYNIGGQTMQMSAERIKADQVLVQIWDDMFTYYLRRWMPLNQENYLQYQQLEGIAEKCAMLEKTLVGNILSFAKGVGIHFDKQVICKITSLDEPQILTYKGVKMMNFDLEFKTNVSLPDFIGLGKGVSLGHGVIKRKRNFNDDRKTE